MKNRIENMIFNAELRERVEDNDKMSKIIDILGDSVDFRSELSSLLNRYSKENGSNTPDYILRDYLCNCLNAFDLAVRDRDKWYNGSKIQNEVVLK